MSISDAERADAARGDSPVFATTRWTTVVEAAGGDSEDARMALEELCLRYWHPLYAFVRRSGKSHEDAQDLTQGFLGSMIEKRTMFRADRSRGRFRSFLLASMRHYLADERDHARAQRRGGGRHLVSLDELEAQGYGERYSAETQTPETLFNRRWAELVLDQAQRRVRQESAASGKAALFERLRPYLAGRGATPVNDLAREHGLSEAGVKSAIHRLRRQYFHHIRQVVGETLEDPAEVDGEIRFLLDSLRG